MNLKNLLRRFFKHFSLTPLSLSLIYITVGSLWIVISGYLVKLFTQNPTLIYELELLKGFLFVFATGAVLYVLLRRWLNDLLSINTLLTKIIDTAPVRIFWKNKELEYLGCNTAFAKDAGKNSPEEIIGKNDYQLSWKEQAELYRADDRHVIDARELKLSFEEPQTTPDGGRIWLSTSKVPLVNQYDEVIGVLGIYDDITERKNIELALLREKTATQNYLDIVGVIILVLDTDKNVKLINQYGCEVIGYSAEEIIGKNWVEHFLPKRFQTKVDEVADSLTQEHKERITYFENPILTKSGEERLIAWRNTSLFDEKGNIIGLLTSGEDITERKKAEINLRATKERLKSIIANEPECVKLISREGKLLEMNPAGLAILEADTLQEAQKLSISDYLLPEYRADFMALHNRIMQGEKDKFEFEIIGLKGTHRWLETNAVPMHDSEGNITMMLGITRDITERKRNESELIKLSQALEQSPTSIIITDLNANIEYVNKAFSEMTGYTQSEVLGKNPRFLQSDKTSPGIYVNMWSNLIKGEIWNGELVNRNKDGSEYLHSFKISPIFGKDNQITHYMSLAEDITKKKEIENKIHYLANFDSLTGLPNREHMKEHFNHNLSLSKRNNRHFAIIFLDLDHFKEINDSLGHSYGDILLRDVSKRLKASIREEDTLSRLGGDEFILLLPDTDSIGAAQVTQKILEIIRPAFSIESHELSVTASLGIAIYPVDGTNMELLLKNADSAMYRAKQEGRDTYCFFTEEMQKRSTRNLLLNNALRHAINNNELSLVYQPQFSSANQKIIGAEALLRWNHPEFGIISPMEFIPIAENSGLILSIGEWVLRTAINQAKQWMDEGLEPIIMAVNLSAIQFKSPNLPFVIAEILQDVGLAPEYLELELTESVAMHDPHRAITIMNELHEKGIRMSIDDFGTGYSSLSYLKKFNIYKLKIDQSFVRDINVDPEDKAIVAAIINMAKSLGLLTIAEGVETIAQLEYLREQGCNEIQGYYFSKPLPKEAFELFREKHSASSMM
ncbi:EAL domain-containing protein [Sulfuricurvum sp.]|uniref:EAL domain-containing protein n=1 Tax=Sulfuricurvum sp. TaxID=2025608 RepID=UPI002626A60C|nr:EAL domain-containing protein [Sulfuricurvum sp.]MDD2267173.1 EAL domain-containing protein [Sulfuricurvum sp.]MDD2784886.1 EAL domain-containing protein [Sulfuricurvum sp.]